jgi:alpha-mannosidase
MRRCLYTFLKSNLVVVPLLKKRFVPTILLVILNFYGSFSKAQSRLYLSNDNHTDYMWSADEPTYDTAFVNMIDAWMANNNATSNNLPDYQTKFNCDGTYWAWAYEKHKTAGQFQDFINQIKNEKIVLPMNPLIITYGCVPAEAAIRGMYYAGELQRKYNIPFEMAMSMENQVLPLGLPSLWAGCGAKYAWHGICGCSTKVPDLASNRDKEIYWYRGLDNEGVLMKWYTKTSDHILGNYSEARNPTGAINDLTVKVNTSDYNYNIAGAFGVGGDELETTTDNLATLAQSESDTSRRVIVSNELDFFRDFETTYGATLPSLTQSYGNEWEHACASLAEVSANVKRSLEKLRSAEAMATLVARTNPSFAHTLDSLRKEAWMSLGLYWEHGFGGFGPAVTNDERAAWQVRTQQNFSAYVDQLYALSMANLASQVNKGSANQRFFIFNPLGWPRTDYTDFAYNGTLPVHVVDVSTNAAVRSQVVTTNGVQYLRVLAPDIPSVGYKVLEIRNGADSVVFGNAASVDINTRTIESDYFTIVFTNNGAITSLIDKTNGNKQLVNTGSDSDYINNIARNTTFIGNSNSNGSFTIENNGAVSVTVRITSTAVINHETSITVFKNIPRVEIDNKITQNFNDDFLYTTFSFNNTNISAPTIWHEENGAVINAKRVSHGGHYADRQARYDWLTLNHFAAISNNGNYGVTLSNQDCYFMQTGNSTIENMDENTAKIKVLVGGRIDGGMFNQLNNTLFNQRYAISAYNTYSAANSMKSALEHQNGLVSAAISNTSGILPGDNFSFMNISDPNTLLWALKPAEEGMDSNGAIVRVWNLANTPTNTDFILNDDITEAKNITHIETDVSEASFSNKTVHTTIGKNQLKTYRVKLTPSGGPLTINLTEFTGIKQNGINKLSWRAEEGANFSNYTIERSEGGNSFDSIGTIDGNGNLLYNYDDTNIDELKPYYYRLKLVQKNGDFIYSKVILITVDPHTKDMLLHQNPVHDQLKFQLVLAKKARYDVWINDISGKTIMKLAPPLFEPGNNYFTINTSNLPVGTYILIVRNTENKYIRKIIKQ